MVVTALGTGTGAAGTYTVSNTNAGSYSGTGSAALAGTLGSSGSPVNIFAFTGFYYYGAVASTNPSGGSVTALPRANQGDFVSVFGTGQVGAPYGAYKDGWGGTIGNVAMLYGVLPQTTGGAPSTASLASLCKKTTDIQSFAAANGMTVNSLYRLNDFSIYGNSGYATVQGYVTNSTGTNATLNVIGSPIFGSLTAAGSVTAKLTGVGLSVSSPPTVALTGSSATTYAITPNTTAAVGSSGSPVTFSLGAFAPMTPLQSSTFTGYIDNAGSVPTLHVTALPTTPAGAAAAFTGSLTSSFTGSTNGTTTLTVTSPTNAATAPVIGVGTQIQTTIGTVLATVQSQLTSTAASGVLGLAGTYQLNTSVASASGTFYGTGPLPAGPATLTVMSGLTGSLNTGQYVTDGGASLTAQPLLIMGGGSGSSWSVAGNYYPSIVNDATMVASLSSIVPGTYVQNSAITTPVKVLSYQGPCSITGAIANNNGGLGCYTLSASPNAAGTVGSSGSPVTLTAGSISDGGAIAPGLALTIKDQGPGITFPVTPSTISCSGFGSCTGTGSLYLTGTYDTSVLGGSPTGIQAQVSLSAGGPPVPGCSACAWTSLTGYSATLSSGTVYNWAGSAINIPANSAPLFVSVRAANGTAYATLPNSIKVGLPFEGYGQGQFGAFPSTQSGFNWSYFAGLWGSIARHSAYSGNEQFLQGPPITGAFVPSQSTSIAGDRFGITGLGNPLSEGVGTFEQLLTNAFGWPASFTDMTHDGVGNLIMTLGNVTQTQTVGVGNGSSTTWCSASKFCAEPSGGDSTSADLQRRRLDRRAIYGIGGDLERRLDAHSWVDHDERRAHARHGALGCGDHRVADAGQLHLELRQRDGDCGGKFTMDAEREPRDHFERGDARRLPADRRNAMADVQFPDGRWRNAPLRPRGLRIRNHQGGDVQAQRQRDSRLPRQPDLRL